MVFFMIVLLFMQDGRREAGVTAFVFSGVARFEEQIFADAVVSMPVAALVVVVVVMPRGGTFA
jgi:hypothetical protein